MVRLRLSWATSNFCAAALMLPQSTTVTKYSRLLRCILCFLSCARSKTDTDPCRKPVLCRNTDRKPDSCIPCAGGSSAGDTKGPQKRTLARAAASGAVFVKALSRPGRGYSPTVRSARRPGLKEKLEWSIPPLRVSNKRDARLTSHWEGSGMFPRRIPRKIHNSLP